MSHSVTRRFSRFTGVGAAASLTTVPMSIHGLTEQERQGILAKNPESE